MGYEHHWFFPFGFFFIILAVFVIFRVIMFNRYRHGGAYAGCGGYRSYHQGHWHNSQDEAEAIIRKRLANGEINEEEYQHLKEILNK